MRTIHFSVNQKQAGWLTKVRPKRESGINNEFELIYKQEDYALNLCLWDRVKEVLQGWIDLKNRNLVLNAINIPVRNFGQNEIGM
jgi:hypothetical protein